MATTIEKPEGAERYFGRGVKRREDPKLITGRGRYTDDVHPTGALHVAILRSPYAHARITSIDTTAAHALPGVVAVYTGADIKESFAGLPCRISELVRCRYLAISGMTIHQGLCSLKTAAA